MTQPVSPCPIAPPFGGRRPRLAGLALLAALAAGVAVPAGGLLDGAAAQAAPSEAGAPPAASRPQPRADHVLAISLDGLNPSALTRLGRRGAPHLWRLADEGAHTFNARAAVERTETLPNHTSMVTGRRITARRGGHGVTWNDDRPRPATVQQAAGHRVASMFSVVRAAGGSSALFSTKTKLSLFGRSWPDALTRMTIDSGDDEALVNAARTDLATHARDLTFVHLGAADAAGHRHGWMSERYLDTVRDLDVLVGRLLATVTNRPGLARTVVVLTADHGGTDQSHADATDVANFRIPFFVWGHGVDAGPLYGHNPRYRNPRAWRIWYAASPGPVRNGDLANLSLDLLGLGPVPGSTLNRQQTLRVG